MNLIILYQRRSRTALLGVALTALLLITHLQNNSPIRYRALALFFAKAQQAEASRMLIKQRKSLRRRSLRRSELANVLLANKLE